MKLSVICLLALALSYALLFEVRGDSLRDGDVFEMRLSGPPDEFTRDFSLVLTVDEGSVNVPLIGRVRALGFSSSQLASVIEKRLKDDKIFTVATVNITVNPVATQRWVIVGGAVKVPGRQPYLPDLTLMGAINSAGGVNEWVKDTVKIVRGGRAERHSLKAIKKNSALDPRVQAGDNIDVEGS